MSVMRKPWRIACLSVVALGLVLRLALLIWAGNAAEAPFSGGSDTLAYQTLAVNLLNHRGLSYAGQPTALRPPFYPFFLAIVRWSAGEHYRLFVRLLQFLSAIALAYLCGTTARRLHGSALAAFTTVIAAPTLAFLSAEILTDPFAALLVGGFLYATTADLNPIAAGAIIGLAMLERFNLATLAIVYTAYHFVTNGSSIALKKNIPGCYYSRRYC